MKQLLPLILVLIFCLVSVQSNLAQSFPFEKYDPRTLAELVEMAEADSKNIPADKGQMIINGKPFYSAVRVKYIGTSKPVAKEEMDYLKLWQGSLGYDPEILKLYENKYLFKECEKEYWLPVQKQVAAYFPKELKSGDMITLYLMFPGGLKPKPTDNWNFIFLTNEFRKYEAE
jgi:hypothetical protein